MANKYSNSKIVWGTQGCLAFLGHGRCEIFTPVLPLRRWKPDIIIIIVGTLHLSESQEDKGD